MSSDVKLKSQILETYSQTLELAKSISKNRFQYFDDDIEKDHVRFLKNIAKGYRDFKDLSHKYSQNQSKASLSQDLSTLHSYPSFKTQPKDSSTKLGKIILGELVKDSYSLARKTRTGRGGLRHLTPSPPPVLEKIKKNKSLYSEPSESQEKPLAFISLLNGKTEEIQLPSFQECVKGNRRIDSQSEMVLKKIERCKDQLNVFEKEINGLEVFCKYNPGVMWNSDKRLLLKLGSGTGNKMALIKAYNERNVTTGSSMSKGLRGMKIRVGSPRKPASEMPIIEEKRVSASEAHSAQTEITDRQASLASSCFESFRKARKHANSKMIQILTKLKVERPQYIRNKAILILGDKEKYKGKIHSFQTLEKYKKFVERKRYSNVIKCRNQTKVYTRLLDYLKNFKGMPSQTKISFVEAIRELLEGGWTMSKHSIEAIRQVYSLREQEELSDLMEIIHQELVDN